MHIIIIDVGRFGTFLPPVPEISRRPRPAPGGGMPFPRYEGEIPYLTTEQMVAVDRAMVEDYRIQLVQMMEHAGGNLARVAGQRFLEGDPRGKRVAVLAGSGGNGGGALVCARHLHNRGARVDVSLTREEGQLKPVPAHQLEILHRMKVPIFDSPPAAPGQRPLRLIIDGIVGYSLKGAPQGTAATLIRWANGQDVPILALDVPSGIDAETGTVFDPAMRATATMTLALPKQGLRASAAREYVGELYLADIGVPPELYAGLDPPVRVEPIFSTSEILRLR
jgi:NAD(P)H-hydrate epimerase